MNNIAKYKIEQLTNKQQLNAVQTLSSALDKCFKDVNTLDYKLNTQSSLVFRIENKTTAINNSKYCVYVTKILEFGEATLDYFVCTGLDTVAIMLMSFKELIYLGEIYGENFVSPKMTRTLFRGEEQIFDI